jgi:hypothetical protein
MQKRLSILFGLVIIALLGVLIRQALPTRDRPFHGKPEGEWI